MKINYEKEPCFCKFRSLSYGDCFIFDDAIFMIVNPSRYDGSNVPLAVSLGTGKLCRFCEGDEVIPVEAELTIK